MKSFVRYQKNIPRRIAESRFSLIRAQIGYLYRTETGILSYPMGVGDVLCRDGALLRMPDRSFTDVYYSMFLPEVRNDVNRECTAVYFDPYAGVFVVVGSKRLFLESPLIKSTSSTIYLEEESPFRFTPETYGAYLDVETESMTFADHFVPDVTGVTVADCMLSPKWDNKETPWRVAMRFFDRYADKLFADAAGDHADTLTTLLAKLIHAQNHELLAQLFALQPNTLSRFRPILHDAQKFYTLSRENEKDLPPIVNLFHYTILFGGPDIIETLFHFYPYPLELSEYLHHPMFAHVGFYHVRSDERCATLACLLAHGFNADAVDADDGRMTLLSYACKQHHAAATALLVRHGAGVTRMDEYGKCALDYAAEANTLACFATLLAKDEGRDKIREHAASLAAEVPFDDDNQGLLCLLREFIQR